MLAALLLCLASPWQAPLATQPSFTLGSGKRYVAKQREPFVLRVRNPAPRARKVHTELWVPPELKLDGIPAVWRLDPGRNELRGDLVVEADRPAGELRFDIVLRDEQHKVFARSAVRIWCAVGRDYARHGRSRTLGAEAFDLLGDRPPFAAADFPYVTLWVEPAGKLRLRIGTRQNGRSVPVHAAGRGRRRVVVPLGTKSGTIESLSLVGRGRIDDVAIVRRPELLADDRLRRLRQGYRRRIGSDRARTMLAELATIDHDALGTDGRIDAELLEHALRYRLVTAGLPPKQPGRPAGKRLFEAMLRYRHHLDLGAADLIRIGMDGIRTHQKQLEAVARTIDPKSSWRDMVETLRGRHRSAADLPGFANEAMQRALAFTIEKDLVTVPMAARSSRIRVVTDGRLSRTYPFGGYGGARRSPNGYTGTYFVSPPATWMNDRQALERLEGNHDAWTRVVALHEIVPGHHLQTVVHRMRPLSRFRRSFYSTLFAEGWALYCEDMLYEAGFFPDADTRFTQLHMRLWRACRVVIDASLHTGKMTMAEAEKLLVDEAAFDPTNAHAEVLRYIDNPTRPMSYFIGWKLIKKLFAAAQKRDGPRFNARTFRDRLLKFGPIPIPAIAKALGDS